MRKNKSLNFALIKIIFAITVSLLVVFYFNSAVKRDINEIKQKQALKEALNHQSTTQSALEKEYKQLEPGWISFSEIFPLKDKLSPFLDSLESLASQTNNTQTISFTEGKEASKSKIVSDTNNVALEVNLKGKLNAINQYLSGLENLKYYTTIESINITASSEGSLDLSAIAIIKFRVYTRD
ncbi:hypothetical protein COX95_03405 [bacterium CG_4_10_14_0_2_um_filter_33_32]|nr:MAG: hypothetical protein AUJ93_04885 [bacterium CG2_30_33_46]PIR67539.1 MAG: hypothetical protein COU50_02825 [bacterium CG10_big_fil_rev_8_21_14_0_10_33_18]PIU77059.1 MAG: hypothetical protein COS74_00860 [bacterium CG06_land_8_20_14_3_00_33_50]PIW80902.1 MAG: hypothetical protein COZ97_04330 [bacterium CG_4_8_14_3_um_filter_33_28]PIY85325.1 MAG: hypothetical protein COY76_02655 [bacterium CG_4_10_14_0_8_um_filter_33_57]PIZ85612.1 MAG: hypothetical protein COX95_03405 [bacterium CG_4_10_1